MEALGARVLEALANENGPSVCDRFDIIDRRARLALVRANRKEEN